MDGPPPEVLTGVLRGGALDGLVLEIAPGQATIEPAHLITIGTAFPAPIPRYCFTGEIDDEDNAVYVPDRTSAPEP